LVEDSVASNGPVHGTITKRYLQGRSMIFRSSDDIARAIAEGSARLGELFIDKEPEVVPHTSPRHCERTWRLAAGKKSDVDAAVAESRRAFQDWRRVSVDELQRLLPAFGCQLQKHEAKLVDDIVDHL